MVKQWFLGSQGHDFDGCGAVVMRPCRTLNFTVWQVFEHRQQIAAANITVLPQGLMWGLGNRNVVVNLGIPLTVSAAPGSLFPAKFDCALHASGIVDDRAPSPPAENSPQSLFIVANQQTLTLNYIEVLNCGDPRQDGGVIAAGDNCNISISGSIFHKNRGNAGSVLKMRGGSLSVWLSLFAENEGARGTIQVRSDSPLYPARVMISQSVFTNNTASNDGGLLCQLAVALHQWCYVIAGALLIFGDAVGSIDSCTFKYVRCSRCVAMSS